MEQKKSLLSILPIIIVVICSLFMSFLPNNLTWILYPLILIIGIKPYTLPLKKWIQKNMLVIIIQLFIAGVYYLIHNNNISALELWSDEILSLKIAHNPFSAVAKQALTIGAFPPIHYWELWFLEHIYGYIPAQYIELGYRIVPMIYHIFAGILFSAFIQYKLIKIQSSRIYQISGTFVAFFSYFFNPLLFPYSLEIRPYVMMSLISVLTLIVIDTEVIDTLEFVPLHILFFLISFFYAILYIPVAIWQFARTKSRLTPIYTIIPIGVVYFFYIPYIGNPISGALSGVQTSIRSSLSQIQQVLFPTIIQLIFAIGATIYAFKEDKKILYIAQTLTIFSVVTILGIVTRYTALAPRHYIFAIPLILYILISPIIRPTTKYSYIILGLFCLIITIPWIYKTDLIVQKQQFFPKVSTGIKKVLTNAKNNNIQHIFIEKNTDEQNPYYWNYAYINYVADWYISRYGFNKPTIVPSESICQTHANSPSSLILIYFTTKCPQLPKTASLNYKILDK